MMRKIPMFLGLLTLGLTWVPAAKADTTVTLHTLGQAKAPVTVEEFVSLTCPHCAEFYEKVLPEIEKRYVDTGKIKIVLHNYPLDGLALRAAALASCMPDDEYFPFIKTLYENQQQWVTTLNPENMLIQYAGLGGVAQDKARACLNDISIQNAIVADRTAAQKEYDIQSTPTFVFNKGADRIQGSSNVNEFSAVVDRQLAAHPKP